MVEGKEGKEETLLGEAYQKVQGIKLPPPQDCAVYPKRAYLPFLTPNLKYLPCEHVIGKKGLYFSS